MKEIIILKSGAYTLTIYDEHIILRQGTCGDAFTQIPVRELSDIFDLYVDHVVKEQLGK